MKCKVVSSEETFSHSTIWNGVTHCVNLFVWLPISQYILLMGGGPRGVITYLGSRLIGYWVRVWRAGRFTLYRLTYLLSRCMLSSLGGCGGVRVVYVLSTCGGWWCWHSVRPCAKRGSVVCFHRGLCMIIRWKCRKSITQTAIRSSAGSHRPQHIVV